MAAAISGHRVAIRAAPRLTGKIARRLDWDTQVQIVERDGKWLRVREPKAALEGWVEDQFVRR